MAVKLYKPTSPARRGMSTQDFDEITSKTSLRRLTVTKKAAVARNNQGRITTRHRGGGAKRRYRLMSFKLDSGTKLTIEEIEYDPNRSARIARVKDGQGTYHYILAAKGMKKGGKLAVGEGASIETGNRLQLRDIPTGAIIHAIELSPGKNAQLARSAGTGAQLVAKEEDYGQVRLPSGEVRRISLDCMASIGSVGNEQHSNIQIGSAGRKRHMGIRPSVRGVVMSASDHPHGGGDGGRHRMARPPTTPWGQKTLGYKTRRRKVNSKFIVKSRHESKRR
jgi:large subunit ribosomal protein L2